MISSFDWQVEGLCYQRLIGSSKCPDTTLGSPETGFK